MSFLGTRRRNIRPLPADLRLITCLASRERPADVDNLETGVNESCNTSEAILPYDEDDHDVSLRRLK
jgi:hypothetical protein